MVSDSKSRGRGRWWIAALAAVVGVTVGAVAVKTLGSSSSTGAVTLEPAHSVGADPFTAPMTAGQLGELPGNVRAVSASIRQGLHTNSQTHALVAVGTAPGLYGGSGDVHVCDPQKLVAYLNAHPDKAGAWARVLGISPKNIGAYVATLTPVVLTSDTFVTNHGYHNGAATSLQSVLQAGTAVMVDRTGTPRVKCNCGNPLTPPQAISLSSATVRGTPWPGYAPVQVTIVQPGTIVGSLTLVNVITGQPYPQETGSTTGGVWVATVESNGSPQTTVVTSPDGRSWAPAATIPGESVRSLVWGGDRWLAVANRGDTAGTQVLQSGDLRSWSQVATVADSLTSIGFGDGRWVASGVHWNPGLLSTSTPHSNGVAYTSTDGTHWSQSTSTEVTTQDQGFDPKVARGSNDWLSVSSVSSAGAVPGLLEKLTVLTSADGTRWQPNGGTLQAGGSISLAYGSGTWVIGSNGTPGAPPIQISRDAVSWTPASVTGVGGSGITAVASGDGKWLAASQGSPTLLGSTDASSWSPVGTIDANVDALAFGGTSAAPARSAPTSTTTATAAAAPCSRQALQAAFSNDPQDDMDTAILNADEPPLCAGGWAAVHYGNQGRFLLAVFRANGATWSRAQYQPDADPGEGGRETAHALCADPSFPQALHQYACPGQ